MFDATSLNQRALLYRVAGVHYHFLIALQSVQNLKVRAVVAARLDRHKMYSPEAGQFCRSPALPSASGPRLPR